MCDSFRQETFWALRDVLASSPPSAPPIPEEMGAAARFLGKPGAVLTNAAGLPRGRLPPAGRPPCEPFDQQEGSRDLDHRPATVHGGLLDSAEGFCLAQPVPLHQDPP